MYGQYQTNQQYQAPQGQVSRRNCMISFTIVSFHAHSFAFFALILPNR